MSLQLEERSAVPDLVRSGRWLASGIFAGYFLGALIGGVGGRIAMFVLRRTSSPSLIGIPTDDGFTIGVVSSETLFLLFVTAGLGLLGGLFYLSVRPWLPVRGRVVLTGLFGAVVGGAGVIRPDGLDFTVLEPLPLAVVMFIAIPAAFGVALSVVIERQLKDDSFLQRSKTWVVAIALFLPLALTGPVGIFLLLAAGAVWFLHRWKPSLGDLWRSVPVMWIGRGLLLAIIALNLNELARDVSEIL